MYGLGAQWTGLRLGLMHGLGPQWTAGQRRREWQVREARRSRGRLKINARILKSKTWKYINNRAPTKRSTHSNGDNYSVTDDKDDNQFHQFILYHKYTMIGFRAVCWHVIL